MKIIFALLSCILAFAISSLKANAVDGYSDPTFTGGNTAFSGDPYNPSSPSDIEQIIAEGNGNLLLGGSLGSSVSVYGGSWWLGELRPNGAPVLTFGESNGIGRITACILSTTFCGNTYGFFASMIVQADGGIDVLDGYGLTRTTAQAQSLDIASVVGGTGIASSIFAFNSVGGALRHGNALAQTGSGKWLVAGVGYYTQTSDDPVFGVVRLNADFSRDDTFNATTDENGATFFGGQVVSFGPGINSQALAVLTQTDGRIVLAGKSNSRLAIARLQANGAIDTTFGVAGKTVPSWSGGTLYETLSSRQVTFDRSGRLLVPATASATGAPYPGMGVTRFTSNGILDTSFAAQGISYQPFSSFCTRGAVPSSLAMDSAGRIIAAGYCSTSDRDYFFVERLFGDNGALDTSFGVGGRSFGAFDGSGVADHAFTVVFDSGGRPVLGGSTTDSTGLSRAGVARLTYDLIFTNNLETTAPGRLPGQ